MPEVEQTAEEQSNAQDPVHADDLSIDNDEGQEGGDLLDKVFASDGAKGSHGAEKASRSQSRRDSGAEREDQAGGEGDGGAPDASDDEQDETATVRHRGRDLKIPKDALPAFQELLTDYRELQREFTQSRQGKTEGGADEQGSDGAPRAKTRQEGDPLSPEEFDKTLAKHMDTLDADLHKAMDANDGKGFLKALMPVIKATARVYAHQLASDQLKEFQETTYGPTMQRLEEAFGDDLISKQATRIIAEQAPELGIDPGKVKAADVLAEARAMVEDDTSGKTQLTKATVIKALIRVSNGVSKQRKSRDGGGSGSQRRPPAPNRASTTPGDASQRATSRKPSGGLGLIDDEPSIADI